MKRAVKKLEFFNSPFIVRRRGDSNPRTRYPGQLLSREPDSAALAPLQKTEGEGFEPPVSCPTAAFKAATIDLSDILPVKVTKEILGKGRYRVKLYSALTNIKNIFFEVFVVRGGYFPLNFYANTKIFINKSSIIFLSA